MDAQQTTVLIAMMVGGGVVHPMMPKTDKKMNETDVGTYNYDYLK